MAPYTGEPSQTEQIVLALAPKVAAFFSVLGSSYIIYDVLRKKTTRQEGQSLYSRRPRPQRSITTYHRLMVGLSVCDISMSCGLFTSTWFMPRNTPHVWGARGTTVTCEVIGFFEQAGVAAVLYNGSLSTYYLLRIRSSWVDAQILRIEPILHAIPIVFGLSTMIAGIPLKLYNSGIFDCWIAPYPQGCTQSWKSPDHTTNCIRGDNSSIYQWAFDIVPKFSSIFLVTINMILTYLAVKRREQSSQMYTAHISSQLSRRLARQSYLYVGALYITYIPVVLTRMTQLIRGYTYYGMLLTIAITIPLQGCWNFIVYLRPRYLQARERQRRQQQSQATTEKSDSTISQGGGGTRKSSNRTASEGRSAGYFQAVSEAVREGELGEDEEDYDDSEVGDEQKETEGVAKNVEGPVIIMTTDVLESIRRKNEQNGIDSDNRKADGEPQL